MMHSYAIQHALFDRLTQTAAITDEVGTAIFDTLPNEKRPELYIQIGESDVRDLSGHDAPLFAHRLIVDVIGHDSGFHDAKSLGEALMVSLREPLELSTGQIVTQNVDAAQARRVNQGNARRLRYVLSCLVTHEPYIEPVLEPTE